MVLPRPRDCVRRRACQERHTTLKFDRAVVLHTERALNAEGGCVGPPSVSVTMHTAAAARGALVETTRLEAPGLKARAAGAKTSSIVVSEA